MAYEPATRPGLLARLLPPTVVTRETTADLRPDIRFPVEEAVIAKAVDARRREFVTTRTCAREALTELGLVDMAIPRGPAGSPVWPAQVVGSLTHCPGYRAAAVAWQQDIRSLGIDAEPCAGLPSDVLDLVADAAEQDRLATLLDRHPAVPWDRLLFSAKESVYKAYFPVTGRWLDFADVEVIIAADGSFSARLRGPQMITNAGLESLAGRWSIDRSLIATAVVIRGGASGQGREPVIAAEDVGSRWRLSGDVTGP